MNVSPQIVLKEKIIEASEYTKAQQVGTDVSIGETIVIPHGEARAVRCSEIIRVPNSCFAILIHRSSFNRKGVLITGSVYDPSYQGVIGATIYNLSGETITILKGERIAQVIVFECNASSHYNGQYQFEGLKETQTKLEVLKNA